MRNILKTTILAFLLTSCGSTAPTTGETTSRVQKVGTITIAAKGYGKKEDLAIAHAKEQAFVNLLFRGIPNTSYSNAGLVGNEAEARKTHIN